MGILDDAIREHLELKRRRGADNAEVARQEREILGGGDATFDAAATPAADFDPAFDAPAPPTADPLYGTEPAYDDEPVEPLAGSPLAEPEAPLAPEPSVTQAADDLFPGTGELLAAASEAAPAPAPIEPPVAPVAPATPAPAASDDDAARTGARRLSDEELAAWRKRLSERADRLAAQRPGGATEPVAGADPDATAARIAPRPASSEPAARNQPPAYWSGTAGAPATPAGGADTGAPGVPVDFFDAGDAEQAFSPEPAPEPQADPDHDVLDETPDFLSETPEHDRMWFEQRPPRDFDFG